MQLTAKVIEITSGDQFVDKRQRVRVKLTEDGQTGSFDTLYVPNTDNLTLDQQVVLEVRAK